MVTDSEIETPAGWAVCITTEEQSLGHPAVRLCAVALSEKSEAEEAVRNRAQPAANEKIMAVSPLKQSTLEKLGLAPGEAAIIL